MGVEDDPIVMGFLRLPAAQAATVNEIDVNAGKAKLKSTMDPKPKGGWPIKGHRT